MTQFDLQSHVRAQLHFLKGYFKLRSTYDNAEIDEVLNRQTIQITNLIKQHVEEVIGEDEEDLRYESEHYYHRKNIINAEHSNQRKRAGL